MILEFALAARCFLGRLLDKVCTLLSAAEADCWTKQYARCSQLQTFSCTGSERLWYRHQARNGRTG
jgi:hypothetical protein